MKQLLYFSKPSCGPCQSFKPTIEKLKAEFPITIINTDTSIQTAQQYNIRSVPTLLLIKNGVEVGRLVGVKTEAEVRALYNR